MMLVGTEINVNNNFQTNNENTSTACTIKIHSYYFYRILTKVSFIIGQIISFHVRTTAIYKPFKLQSKHDMVSDNIFFFTTA